MFLDQWQSRFISLEAAEKFILDRGFTILKTRDTYRDYILFRPGYKYALVYRAIQYSIGFVKLFLLRSQRESNRKEKAIEMKHSKQAHLLDRWNRRLYPFATCFTEEAINKLRQRARRRSTEIGVPIFQVPCGEDAWVDIREFRQ